ncbi:g11217 [Coccomyxa elongata]
MPTPTRNAWFRHHQQSRTGTFRLVHFQVLGALVLALAIFSLLAHMRPYQMAFEGDTSERARPERTWAPFNGDHLLSLFGMAQPAIDEPLLGSEGSRITMQQHTNVSVKLAAAYEKGSGEAASAQSTGQLPAEGWRANSTKKEELGADAVADELQRLLQEARGMVPRLNASVGQPFGPHDLEQSPLCSAFRAPGTKTVAIVGNGPLDHAQRRDIDACDVVVRFNLMNNWRRFKERVDIWVFRYSTEASLGYWGITNMLAHEATNVVQLMKAVWLVGGRQKDADGLVKKVPAIAQAHPVLIPQEPLAVAYSRQMNVTNGYPSTGFVGLLGALSCTTEDTMLHLFGFNWHNSTWKGHKMEAEKAFVEWLAKEGRVVVHETTCYGVRECGGSSTFDASCHWNSSGRYVCLRGKPRKWTDLTDTLGSGRLEEFKGQAQSPPPAASGTSTVLR